jgi:cellulose synthase/poly-beta-1,6-N-acetylglucosamine synthase-like glycosyltransferase
MANSNGDYLMNEHLPFVSVIVPVYNGERHIGNCIKSLLSLNYPSSQMEIIIVDNKSKDSTYRIIQEFPVISLIEDKIQSSYAARNTGLKRSRGEIIAFTDSDCIADKDWIIKAVEQFQDENIGCVAGRIEGYSPSNYIEEYLVKNRDLSQDHSLKHRFLPYPMTANAIYRRKVFDSIGLFEANWISGGDADIAWRMLLHSDYRLVYCIDSLIYHNHRSTLKGFFKQRVTWSYGQVLLHKKYKAHYRNGKEDLAKEIYHDYFLFFRSVIIKMLSMSYYRLILRDKKAFQERMLTMIDTVARRFGRIKGSILEKEFYI